MSDLSSFLGAVVPLVLKAGDTVMSFSSSSIKSQRKEDSSIVTEADHAADKIIREGLQKNFPEHQILTEETGMMAKKSPYTWLVDPLDGTKAYAKGIPGFCVMIGLLYDEVPVLGVVYDPLEDRLYEAVKGEGAFLTEKNNLRTRIRVSSRKDFHDMPLVISTGFPPDKLSLVRQKMNGPMCNPINSFGIKVAYVVRQEADIYINHHSAHYWDTCAPQAILEESGGVITSLTGDPLRYDLSGNFSHGILTVATNGVRHRECCDDVSKIMEV